MAEVALDLDRSSVASDFVSASNQRASLCLREIAKCVAMLSEEQMQERGAAHENSVVNLLAHLEGNIRQWILHGVAEQPDVRERDAEFALEIAVSGAEALARLAATVKEAQAAIAAVTEARLLAVIDPQPNGTWRQTTVLEAIYKVISHLDHHTGQIILLTKQRVGRDLDFSMPRKR
jgi:uncharacterized damage-inducible protein DinB